MSPVPLCFHFSPLPHPECRIIAPRPPSASNILSASLTLQATLRILVRVTFSKLENVCWLPQPYRLVFRILRPASQAFKLGQTFFIFKAVSAFILRFKHLECSNTQTHTGLCDYISSYIWVPRDAGRGSGCCLEPMKRRGKSVFLHHTYIPRITLIFFLSFSPVELIARTV